MPLARQQQRWLEKHGAYWCFHPHRGDKEEEAEPEKNKEKKEKKEKKLEVKHEAELLEPSLFHY